MSVPAQTFTLGANLEPSTSTATVAAFTLDEFEVTVGRFRAFVDAYDDWRKSGNPAVGAGAHPRIAGSGWQAAWPLPESASVLRGTAGVQCSAATQTFTLGDDQIPVNCVSWVEAFAFCIWDGGRLPTEAEWEAAATGGDAGWAFPWGNEQPDPTRAAYDCTGNGSRAQECSVADILEVGSKPAGSGRWGHQDLAGNVWEWALDVYGVYPTVAEDYANLGSDVYRSIRGSGWFSTAADLRAAIRYNSLMTARRNEFGIRCAGLD